MSSYSALDHTPQHLLAGVRVDQLALSREAARRSSLNQAVSDRQDHAVPRPSLRWVWLRVRRVRRAAARPA